MAKLFACHTFRDVTALAEQIFGGVGFTLEFDMPAVFPAGQSAARSAGGTPATSRSWSRPPCSTVSLPDRARRQAGAQLHRQGAGAGASASSLRTTGPRSEESHFARLSALGPGAAVGHADDASLHLEHAARDVPGFLTREPRDEW